MGFTDWIDKGGDWVEGKVEQGKKLVGEGVEYATHKVSDGLDHVGLHDWAESVEDWGDETASDLGAEVDEKQLGQTEEADELIHGDVKRIEAAAEHLKKFHTAFDTVHAGLLKVGSAEWEGEGKQAFAKKFAEHPKKWARAADACEDAAGALTAYGHTVTWAQKQAKEAVRLYKKGKAASKEAVDAHNKKVDAYNAKVDKGEDPGPKPGEFHDPGVADGKEAQRVLAEARKQRNTAAATAKAKVDAATKLAPDKPEFHDRMAGDALDGFEGGQVELLHFTGGVIRSGTDVLKFARGLNPTDPYNLTHPAAYLDTVSNTAAGILSLASHPERLPGALLGTGWGSDPSEAGGRLFGNIIMAIGTGGAGTAAKATEGAVLNATKKAAEEGAEAGARQAGKGAARREAERGPHEGTRPDGTKATKGTDPVDLASGRMFLPQADVVLPGALPLAFVRKAQSGYRAGRWLGPSWSSTADQRLEIDAEGVVFVGEDGMVLSYPHPVPGVATLPVEGPRWPLEIPEDGGYAVRDPASGRVWHFGVYGGGAYGGAAAGFGGGAGGADGPGGARSYENGSAPSPAPAPNSYGDGTAPLEQISDRDGHWIAFERDADGVPTAIVHDSGYRVRVTTGATDGGPRITALHLVGGGPGGEDAELVRYGYTGGDLTEVVNSSGLPLRFEYDERGRITAWTDRNDSRYEYTYDEWDRCVFESGAEGHMRATLEYGPRDPDTGLSVTTLTNSLGHKNRYVINRALQVVTEIDPTGAAVHSRWDRYDRLCARTDALGRTTEYRRDEAGRLTAVVRPDGRAATASYSSHNSDGTHSSHGTHSTQNGLGKPETITEPDGTTWHQTFDDAGRRTSVTDPAGATTRFTYDALGHPASVTDALGATTRIRCDAAGLPVEITDPLDGTTTYRRDAFGRITAIIDPMGATTRLSWSVEGQLVRRVEADGSEQSWTYDGEGNRTSHTDALGGVTRSEYTHFDQLSARTGPDGMRHEFRHNTQLQLVGVVNPQGLEWSYEYDPTGRLLAETDFDGRTLTYAHDAAGRLTSRTDALGQTIGYEHDVLDRVVAKDAAGKVTRFRHDVAGRLMEAAGPDATLVYGRDRLGRVKSQTCDGRTLTFAYDELGRRTRRVTPTGAVSTGSYDAAGRRTSVSASGHAFALEHDAAGREVARHFGDALSLTQAWDPAGRLTDQTVTAGPSAAPLQTRAYTYRRDGNLTAVDDLLSGPRSFGLDATGRVTSVDAPDWTERYAYDAAGNQSEADWPDDHPGAEARGARSYTGTRVTRAGAVRYEYDALGRVVLRQKTRLSRKPDTWRYEWDAEDRLTSVTTPDGTRWRYRYDPLGRRTAKQRLTESGEVAEQTDFTWDGPTLTEQTTTTSTHPNSVTLTWDHNGLQPIAQTERITAAEAPQQEIDQRFFAIITDLVGTPSELVAESGEIAWRKRSTLWGTTTWPANSPAYTPLRFPGQYFDPETGLHYNYHRHYDPETARYATPDPLGLAPAPNPVAYVHNPHTWADLLGLAPGCGDEISLFKAPARGQGQYHYDNGFLESDFPGGPHDPYADGKAYFAKERELADNYAKHYGDGVIEVRIPADKYAEHFKEYEYLYEGGPLTEVVIPKEHVEKLNEHPRDWHR